MTISFDKDDIHAYFTHTGTSVWRIKDRSAAEEVAFAGIRAQLTPLRDVIVRVQSRAETCRRDDVDSAGGFSLKHGLCA